MPDGVMANISHFDCDVSGSNPGLATKEHVGFSLTGKAFRCMRKEPGSPNNYNYREESTIQYWLIVQWKNTVLRTQGQRFDSS